MTLLGTAISLIAVSILSIPAGRLFRRRKMKMSLVLLVLCLMAAQHAGGLIFSILLSLAIYLYLRWLMVISSKTPARRTRLFNITIWIAAVYLVSQLIHLPVRLYLHQPAFKIAVNFTSIFFGLVLVAACFEEYSKSTEKAQERG